MQQTSDVIVNDTVKGWVDFYYCNDMTQDHVEPGALVPLWQEKYFSERTPKLIIIVQYNEKQCIIP